MYGLLGNFRPFHQFSVDNGRVIVKGVCAKDNGIHSRAA